MRRNTRLWFGNSLAQYRAASHALLCRRSYAECHTAEVVSHDVGFRPAVPLPAVAILLRVLLSGRACLHFARRERFAALWKPLSLSFYRFRSPNATGRTAVFPLSCARYAVEPRFGRGLTCDYPESLSHIARLSIFCYTESYTG